MIKEEQYHWEHLLIGHSFRNKKFLSMLKIGNKRFFLALNENFVPIFDNNLFLFMLKDHSKEEQSSLNGNVPKAKMGIVHKNKSKLKSHLKDEESMPKHLMNLYIEQIQQPKFDR